MRALTIVTAVLFQTVLIGQRVQCFFLLKALLLDKLLGHANHAKHNTASLGATQNQWNRGMLDSIIIKCGVAARDFRLCLRIFNRIYFDSAPSAVSTTAMQKSRGTCLVAFRYQFVQLRSFVFRIIIELVVFETLYIA